METIRKNENYGMISNTNNIFTVFFGYTAGGEDNCTSRKEYKSYNAAKKAIEKFLNK